MLNIYRDIILYGLLVIRNHIRLIFLFLLFLSFHSVAELKDISSKGGKAEPAQKSVKEERVKPVHKPSKQEVNNDLAQSVKSQEGKAKEENCSTEGQKSLHSDRFTFSTPLSFSNQINGWIDKSLDIMKKDVSKQCPSYCQQTKSYKVLSKTYPQNIEKDSCKEGEANEFYSFKKAFPFEKGADSIKQAHKNMMEWIFSTFVYPYYSPFENPSREFIENKLSEACPSCSFYFDYTYKYTKDNSLELNIKARCGDKKKLLSRFKAEFILTSSWKCKKTDDEK